MKRRVLALLLCLLTIGSTMAASWAGPPAQSAAAPPPPAAGSDAAPTALFRDDFDDTAGLEALSNLVAEGGYLQVPATVTWSLDTFADLYPGSGLGVDLYAQPGAVLLSRFSPDVRVSDVLSGTQAQVDAAYGALIGLEDTPYLYAVWADGRGGDLDIYFSRSTDGGATWEAGRKLNLLAASGDQQHPAIATVGGSVHVAWEDDAGIHYTRSQDWGNTWLTDSLLAAGGSAPDIAAASADPLELVHIVYLAEETPGDADVFCLRSADDGLSWSAPQNVVAGEPAGATQQAPSVAMLAGQDEVWAAWEDDREGEANIYAGRRIDPYSWANLRVDSGPAGSVQAQPAIFFSAGIASARCLWTDDRAGGSDLYWAQYDSDLLYWVELGAVSGPGSAAAAPAVASFGAATYAAWSGAPPGAYDTVRLRAYQGGAWGDLLTAPDHVPGATHAGPALAQADTSQATVAALWSDDRGGDGDVFAATSDGAFLPTGWYTSTVHDFGGLASWGPVSWNGSEIGWTTLETRSGDSPQPDPTWSAWSLAANGGPVPAPLARYLQVRLGLIRTITATSPAVDSVHVQASVASGWGTSFPIGQCVAAWDALDSAGYAPAGTTMTLSVLDITGTALYSDVVTPFDLSVIPAEQQRYLRLRVDMQRSPAASPLLDWWQVTWQEGSTQVSISVEPRTIYTPTVVHLSGHVSATVAPEVYQWDFGDGSSVVIGPSSVVTHTYALAGPYTVTLTATGECGAAVATATLTVAPLPSEPPLAAFSHGPLCPGEIPFTNESSGAIWWRWYFGDGEESGLEHPSHAYAAGDYTLTLAVTNTLGSDAAAELLAVRPAPTAAFTYTVDVLTVAFSSTVSGDPALWWDFGDGITATVAHPVHTYALSGTYTVTLSAANACAAAAVSATVAVVCAPVCGADFAWEPPQPRPGEVVTLTAVVTGTPPLTFTWDLGDGSPWVIGPSSVITHSYALTGTYTVTLAVENRCGAQQAVHLLAVAYPPPPVYRAYLPVVLQGRYGGDRYEPDDTPEEAGPLLIAVPQQHTFGPEGDVDWVYVDLQAGVLYHFETSDLQGGADTILDLYMGSDWVAHDDDGCPNYASCFDFVTATAGRYTLRVSQYPGGAVWGPRVRYTLEVTSP